MMIEREKNNQKESKTKMRKNNNQNFATVIISFM